MLLITEVHNAHGPSFFNDFNSALNFFGQNIFLGCKVTGHEINFLYKPIVFDQALIIGIVVIHHVHHLAMLKSFHLDAIPIQRTVTFRSHNPGEPTSFRPVFYRGQQRVGNFLVVNTIKQVKLAVFDLVIFVKRFILQRGNFSDHLAIFERQEMIRLGMIIKRMLFLVHHRIDIGFEGRCKLWVVLV